MNHFYMLPERAFQALGGRMTLEGGGKGGSAPPPPDYTGAAVAQAGASKEVANMQNYANRPNQVTPWGQTSWNASAMTDPATGQPVTQWTQNQTLNPTAQKALDSQLAMQQGKSDLANSTMGRVQNDFSKSFDYSTMPQTGQNVQGGGLGATTNTTNEANFSADRQRMENAAFDRMRPEHEYQQQHMAQQLRNKGLTPGSTAYNRANQTLNDAQSRERFNAMEAGGKEQANMQGMLMGQQQQAFGQNQASGQQNFGQNMQSSNYQNQLRQQAIAEQMQKRNMSLNEMNAIMTGAQVQSPNMPSFQAGSTAQQAPNYLGAAQAQGSYNQNQQAADAKASGDMWGNVAQVAGTAAMFMSDIRLKSNIKKIGDHPIGVGVYEYDIFGKRDYGVMAQELMQVAPELVHVHPSGYLMVNYGGLHG